MPKYVHSPLPEDPIQPTTTNSAQQRWVWEEVGEVVAHLVCQVVGDEAEVITLFVQEEQRGKGLAKQLFAQAMPELAAQGVVRILLEVRPSNTPATTLYQSLGFAHIHTRQNYYQNPVEEAWILEKIVAET